MRSYVSGDSTHAVQITRASSLEARRNAASAEPEGARLSARTGCPDVGDDVAAAATIVIRRAGTARTTSRRRRQPSTSQHGASRTPSNDVTERPMRPEDDPAATSPSDAAAETIAHAREALADQAARELRDHGAGRGGRIRPASTASAAARTSREPTITPSAPASAAAAACRRRWRCRTRAPRGRGVAALTRASSAAASVVRGAFAGGPGDRDRVDETHAPAPRSAARRSSGVVGATSGTSAMPCGVARLEHRRGLLERQVGDDQPADPARRRARRRSAPGPRA